jgi:nicotinamidase/pyrazinamidase
MPTSPPAIPDPRPGDALIAVHVQNDFVPGGRLPVSEGDAVIPVMNRWIARFHALGLPIVATRDWHPANHCSFVEQGGPWPPHCVAGSPGAAFHPQLVLPADAVVVSQATDPAHEAYSGFQGTDLGERLRAMGVTRLFIGGLATDYCVRETVLDARKEGFDVVLLEDAVRAVEVQRGDGARALEAMRAAGARTLREPA